MKIYMKSIPTHVPPKRVKSALNFYAGKLFPKLKDKITVFLDFTDPGSDNIANCSYLDNHIRPKEYHMQIHPKSKGKQLFKILAHETVHVKQFATGQMTDLIKYPKTVWLEGGKKRYYNLDIDNKMDYWYFPWEIEAYGLENALYLDYITTYNLKITRDLTR